MERNDQHGGRPAEAQHGHDWRSDSQPGRQQGEFSGEHGGGYGRGGQASQFSADQSLRQSGGNFGQAGWNQQAGQPGQPGQGQGHYGQGYGQGNYGQGTFGAGSSGEAGQAQGGQHGYGGQPRPGGRASYEQAGRSGHYPGDEDQDFAPQRQGYGRGSRPGYGYDEGEPRGRRQGRGRYGRGWEGRQGADERAPGQQDLRQSDFSLSNQGTGTSQSHSGRPWDQQYQSWRQSQIDQFDRDYEDYCRERQSEFDRGFNEWRSRRGGQSGSEHPQTTQAEPTSSDAPSAGSAGSNEADKR